MKKYQVILLSSLVFFSTSAAQASGTLDLLIDNHCSEKVPRHIVKRIVTHESKSFYRGKAQPWPWTLNIDGKGRYFQNKESAVLAAKTAIKNGIDNIDLGLGQISWRYHAYRFGWSVENALHPVQNIKVVCDILQESRSSRRVKSWNDSIAYYHRPVMDQLGRDYAIKVLSL